MSALTMSLSLSRSARTACDLDTPACDITSSMSCAEKLDSSSCINSIASRSIRLTTNRTHFLFRFRLQDTNIRLKHDLSDVNFTKLLKRFQSNCYWRCSFVYNDHATKCTLRWLVIIGAYSHKILWLRKVSVQRFVLTVLNYDAFKFRSVSNK